MKNTTKLSLDSKTQKGFLSLKSYLWGFVIVLISLPFSVAFAQNVQISGKVTDEAGEPILGANVVIAGTTNGATTDISGSFSLNANVGDNITVSYVGYDTQNFQVVAGKTVYNITLQEAITSLGTVYVVGSRNVNRSELDSPVPIDVIDIAGLANSTGRVEINQIMQFAAPSFNATKQSGSDGADHIDPASLRGLGPDQTLVLINGKRRHQSSLVNIFGTRGRGNSGTDLNSIPAAAIKRIEVLRDGASAQYGSDAIAGVINIVLKDDVETISGGLTYGAYSTNVGEGYEDEAGDVLYNVLGTNRLDGEDRKYDGNTVKLDLNYGMKLGNKGGFANITTEYLTKQRTLRPGWSWRQGYGTAAVDGFNFMLNSSVPLDENTEVYLFGGRNYRSTDAYAFSRGSFADGDNRSVASLYPNGFTPHITSLITDASVTGGIRHTMDNGWNVDFSNSFGKNLFHYFITGTNNASLGDASSTHFDAGGHSLAMNTTNLDFNKFYKEISSGLNLAFGMEFRTENFEIFEGEEGSYALYDINGVAITNPDVQTPAIDINGDQLPGGSQGFPGYSPGNVVDESRTNLGLYFDTELNVTDDFLVSGALRFEEYSDFGSTFNYKVATRYSVGENLSFRGSLSSGFRAPSLAQIHYNLIFNNIVAGTSLRTLLASNTSTVTKSFGIGQLKQETAQNLSLGFTYKIGGFSATIDAYSISVDDRIILTDNFDATALNIGVEAAQFFANGVDTKTQGLDMVLSYDQELGTDSKLAVSLIGNLNDLTIKEIHNGNLNQYTFFSPFSQAYLEAAAPAYKFGLNLNYISPKFTGMINLTQFSKVELQDFQWVDTPATTKAEADALYAVATDLYEQAMTVDISVGYNFNDNLNLTIGSNNILNKYPTPQFDGWTDQGGFNDSVQMGSDGAFFFARLGFRIK